MFLVLVGLKTPNQGSHSIVGDIHGARSCISCIAMIEEALDVGEYLVKEGVLTPKSEVILADDAIRLPLIGEWIQVNAYINGSFEKENFGWKYWLMPKYARLYFMDVNAMVNASAKEFHQILGSL